MNQYPKTLSAVKSETKAQWAIGDALIAECGEPSIEGKHDGSMKRLEEAAKYLLQEGYEYTINTLGALRQTAFYFKVSDRKPLAWGAHRVARTPEFLEAVLAGAPAGTRITQDYIEGIRSQQLNAERREREEAERKAQKDRERAEKKLREAEGKEKRKAEEELRAAKKKERKVKNAPRKKLSPPAKEEIPMMAIQSRFISDAGKSVSLARKNAKRIADCKDELTPKGIAALTEAALEAANAWTDAARIVRSELVDTNHLSIVGE